MPSQTSRLSENEILLLNLTEFIPRWGKSAWRIMGCILKVASTIVVFESSIHFFLKDAEDESNYEHWYR